MEGKGYEERLGWRVQGEGWMMEYGSTLSSVCLYEIPD